MTFLTSTCLHCGSEIKGTVATGRKKLYCDRECRNASKRITRPRLPNPSKGKGRSYSFLVGHKDYRSHCCLIWPYNRDDKGYGTLGYGGKIYKAHRLMCTMAHGEPPAGHQASHSCGRGHEGCVNPRHLSWQTNSRNQLDRYRLHGRRPQRRGILTKDQKQEILNSCLSMKVSEAAEKFGVKRGTVDYWRRKAKDSQLVSSD
jgi:hypothetical protein